MLAPKEELQNEGEVPWNPLMSIKEFKKELRKQPQNCWIAFMSSIDSRNVDISDLQRRDAQGATVDPDIKKILNRYPEVTAPLPPGLPPKRGIEHHIRLQPGTTPIWRKGWRMSPMEMEEARAQITDLLDKGWIRWSQSPYSAPILFVKKKEGNLRMCVDYRALNDKTIRDRGALPQIPELLDQLAGSAYFSRLDLASGYHQVRVAE